MIYGVHKAGHKAAEIWGTGEYVITEEFTFSECYGEIHYVSETLLSVRTLSSLAVLAEGTIFFVSNTNMVHVPKITHYVVRQTGTQNLLHIFIHTTFCL